MQEYFWIFFWEGVVLLLIPIAYYRAYCSGNSSIIERVVYFASFIPVVFFSFAIGASIALVMFKVPQGTSSGVGIVTAINVAIGHSKIVNFLSKKRNFRK